VLLEVALPVGALPDGDEVHGHLALVDLLQGAAAGDGEDLGHPGHRPDLAGQVVELALGLASGVPLGSSRVTFTRLMSCVGRKVNLGTPPSPRWHEHGARDPHRGGAMRQDPSEQSPVAGLDPERTFSMARETRPGCSCSFSTRATAWA